MGKVNELLTKRLKKNDQTPTKMSAMAQQSAHGNLTGFSGVFGLSELNDNEKAFLETLLHEYATGKENISGDLTALISITSEVKAINNQAAILHGERIKRAQQVLKKYRDGAFTSWLIAAYGNRQTPYNFLQYYEFYTAIPQSLRPQIEAMPRQAIYTLASREGPLKKKEEIVKNYQGETKNELLSLIRETFPLEDDDKRRKNVVEGLIQNLRKTYQVLVNRRLKLTKTQKRNMNNAIDDIYELINE